MALDAGTVEATLRIRDEFTAVVDKVVKRVETLERQFSQLTKSTKRDSDQLANAYKRLSAELDPVVKRTQKYDSAVDVLSRSLKAGKISQADYNRQLDLAKQKYKDVDDSAKRLSARVRDLNKLGSGLTSIGQSLTVGVTVPILALAGSTIKAAKDFESSFAGVDKTVDGLTDSFGNLTAEGAKLQQSIRDLAAGPTPIPIDVNELNRIAEAAGQLGIAREDILAFTRTMADLGQTTNLTSTDAADAIARFQNIFGVAGKEVDRFGSTLVALGNKSASTERDILSMGVRIAAAGNQIGLSQGEVLAFAAALSSVGIEAEAGGSAISKVMIDMAVAVATGGRELENFARVSRMSAADFAESFRTDAAGAVQTFIESLGNLDGEQTLRVLDEMGISEQRMRNALLSAAGAGDLLKRSLDLQAKSWQENTALTDEAAKRYKTFESQLAIFWNQLKDVGITLGTSLIPIMRDMLTLIKPVLSLIAILVQQFSELPKPIRLVAVVVAGLAASMGPLLIITGQLIHAWTSLATVAPKMTSAVLASRVAILGWSGAIAGVIVGIGIINHLLAENKRQQEEYQKAIQRSNELAGISTKKHLENAEALFEEARATIQVLQANLRKQKAELESLQQVNPFFKEGFSAREQEDLRTRREKNVQDALKRTEFALADAREAYVRLESERSKLSKPFEIPEIKSSSIDILSKAEEKLGNKLADIRRELLQSIALNTSLAKSFGGAAKDERTETEKRADSVRRTHTLTVAYLEDVEKFGKSAADGLATLRAREYDSAKAAESAEDSFKSLIDVLKELGKSAAESIDKQLTKSIESGVRAMEEGARRVLDVQKDIAALKFEADFQVNLTNNFDAHSREIESQYVDFLLGLGYKTVEEAERVLSALGFVIDDIKAHISSINDQPAIRQLQESGKTPRRVFDEQIAEIRRIQAVALAQARNNAEQQALITQGAQNQITALTETFWQDQISGWASALSFLGASFGGFIQQLSQAANKLQSGYQAFSGLGTGAGWLGVFVAVVDIAHGLFKAHRENQRNRQFQLGASAAGERDQFGEWQISAAQDTRLNIIKQSRDASNSINEAMEEIATALGGAIKTFESITINIRRDGKYFEALVGNELLGIYGSFEEAMEAALHASLLAAETIITGLSELVQEGLAGLQSGEIGRTSSLDQVVDFLSALKEISELRMPEGALRMQEFTREMDELWRQLTRMTQATEATAQGFVNLIGAEGDSWLDWSRAIRGVQQTRQEELEARKREAELFNKMKPVRVAELNLQILEWKQKAEALRIRGQIVRGGAVLDQGEIEAGVAYLQAKGLLLKAEVDLTNQYLEFINQIIKAIEDLIATLEAIPDIDVGDIKLPRTGGAGGGKGEVREFIADRRFEISTRGMTDWQRAVAELDRTYAPLIEQAGKDIALRNQLIALKKEELALLAQEAARSTVASFREFLGLVTPFEQVRNTAADLIKQIQGSPFGDARKAAMIGRVLEEVERQIEELSEIEAVSLFGDMISRMEAFGATEQQLAEMRRHLAILEHGLALDNYRARIEALKLEGKLAPEVVQAFEASLAWLDQKFKEFVAGTLVIDDGRRFRGYEDAPVNNVIDASNKFADALKKATDLLNKYKEDGLDPLTHSLVQIVGDFKQIRSALGDTPEVMQLYAQSVKRAIDEFLDPIRQTQRDLFFGEASPFDTQTQWARIQTDLAQAEAMFRMGDLRAVEQIQSLVPEFVRLGRLMTPVGSQGFYQDVFVPANRLLNEVLALQVDDLGTSGNPMTVSGVADLTVLSEAQVEILDKLWQSNVRVAEAVESLNNKVNYNTGTGNLV